MKQKHIPPDSSQLVGLVSILVDSYDRGLEFFSTALGFDIIEDTALDEHKRWVVVAPPGNRGARLLLAEPNDEAQRAQVGNQAGGRVGFFLYTDNFQRDYARYQQAGVEFVRAPVSNEYGTVAVFRDCSGNLWDLLEPTTLNTTASGL